MTVSTMRTKIVLLLAASLLLVGVCALGNHMLATKPVEEKPAAEAKTTNAAPPTVWPEGAIVKGRVVDGRGAAVANAEILMLGEEDIIVDAERRNWFVPRAAKHRPNPPSTRTNQKGEFRIERQKGTADRLAVISDDPLLWVVARKNLQGDNVEIKLPSAGSLAIHCDLPGKAAKQSVIIQLRSIEGGGWSKDVLRFHFSSIQNPGDTVFEHLPPGPCAVDRYQETPTGKNSNLITASDRQLVKVESNQRATIRFERKIGRPLTGRVRGLENVKLRYAYVTIMYPGPEEQLEANGRRGRIFTAFDVIPIQSDGRFTTDPIPPGEYHLNLFAVCDSTPEQSSTQSDFDGQMRFTVPQQDDMPKVELVAKPSAEKKDRQPSKDNRVRVVDDAGKPLPAFQAKLHTADAGGTGWIDGRGGVVYLDPSIFREAKVWNVLVRADGYASSLTRFGGEQRNKLQRGEVTFTMRRGQKVELRFRLPEGMTWPKGMLPEAYFNDLEESVRIMRQPSNRRSDELPDFNMLNLREIGAGRFEVRLNPDTPPFHVAIHAPGFLQYFEAGPFTLADAKQGVLPIDVPRPASLDVRFYPGPDNPDKFPFKDVSLGVMRQIQGNSYLQVATDVAHSDKPQLRLTDLSPGTYLVTVRTQPKAESKTLPGTEINPGSYFDQKKLVLEAGKSQRVDFRYEPFDHKGFSGSRMAIVRIRLPDGTPAAGREVTVEYQGSHYGRQVVFTGRVPESGEITLRGLTDRVPSFCPKDAAYGIAVDGERVGHFGFTKDDPSQEFEFHLAPRAGDQAPEVSLRNVATGKTAKLSSLRGKIVCLEFWATWCGPCQPAMAKLNELSAEQSDSWKDRVVLIPVSIDTSMARVQAHVSRRGWGRLDHFWTGDKTASEFDAPAARAFGVWGVPETILIDADGRIVWRGHPLSNSDGHNLKSRIESELTKQR